MYSTVAERTAHRGEAWSLRWLSFDQKSLLLSGSVDRNAVLHVVDTKERKLEERVTLESTVGLVDVDARVTDDESALIVAVSSVAGSIRVYRIATDLTVTPQREIHCGVQKCWHLRLISDDEVATCTGDCTVDVYSVVTGERVRSSGDNINKEKQLSRKRKHRFATALAVSHTAELCAVGYASGLIEVYKLSDLSLVATLKRHARSVRRLAFSPSSRRLLSGSEDLHVAVFDIQEPQKAESTHMLSGHAGWVLGVAWSNTDDSFASVGADGRAKLWVHAEHARDAEHTFASLHTGAITACAYDPTGHYLATCGADGRLVVVAVASSVTTEHSSEASVNASVGGVTVPEHDDIDEDNDEAAMSDGPLDE